MSLILGIETSCDETAVAIVKDGVEVVAEALASSADVHMAWGGVIPEIAARKQVESIIPVLDVCLQKSAVKPSDLDAVAVTVGPGLVGSLVIGIAAAKSLALAWDKPLVAVNHLVGHIYANFLGDHLRASAEKIEFPAMAMVVSGGHTDLVLMKGHGDFEYVGGTLDDAAGEAFDKAARLLGIAPYLGGVKLSEQAQLWNEKPNHMFKRPMVDSGDYNFSFSGIKTAVLTKVKEEQAKGPKLTEGFIKEISFEFEDSVTDILTVKLLKACQEFKVKSVLLGGGVSANSVLRKKIKEGVSSLGGNDAVPKLFIPELKLCTDNAIYIASCANFNFNPVDIDLVDAKPGLSVMDKP